MNKRLKPLLPAIAVALLVQFALAGTAWAHFPTITATITCINGTFVIDYTATAWQTTNAIDRENPEIQILVNDMLVATGAFAAPTYSFSGSVPLPAGAGTGDIVYVTAFAAGTWGSGASGGQSANVALTVPESEECQATGQGRFTGGGFQLRVDMARVTRGLTIHCDLLLSNNLEINWRGNRFHMNEHMSTVACTDDPNIDQFPPAAPLDTLIGVGAGRYNNVPGFTVEFTLVDAGEPGRNDQMQIKIYETANPANVILDIPLQTIDGGNLQAHFDQPHK